MKKIVINSDNRRFNISSIVVGYLEENKEEVLEFEIPEKYAEYGKKACFSANGQTFAKNFDDIISNKLTITRDISQFKELDMTIAFFKIENEDEIVARTSILHILIENAIICDDDIKPDEPKIIILDNLIDEVTKLDILVTKNEKKREEYYQEIQEKVDNGYFNGATFTPSVDTDGNISWSNDKNLSNPTTQNIKGPKGEKGDTYNLTEQDKQDISDMTVESSKGTFNQYYNGKLEDFNSNATSKTNDYNTNADNKIAEYDEHSQELDNKIIDTKNELERVKNDVLETGTDTDTFVHLEDSTMAEYQELSVDGVCEQEITTGKNLFDESIMPTNTMNGIKWEYTNKKIKISGTATDTYSHNENIPITLQAGTYYFVESGATNLTFAARFYNINGELIANSQRYNPFTISENATRIELLVKGITSGTSYNQEMNFMVSTTNGNYEPYTGGQPSPSPDYPQPISTIENSLKITSCNKNLFDKDNEDMFLKNITPDNSGLIVSVTTDTSQTNYVKSIIIKCKPNTRYSISKLASSTFYIYDSEEIPYLNYKTRLVISNSILSTYSFTTSKSAKYIIFKFYNTWANELYTYNEILDSIQIEKGTTATPYEQHLETQINANLPEGEFIGKINDTYKDTLKVEYNEDDGQYHLNLYKRVYKNNSYNGESYNYYISTTARKDGNIECGELQTGKVVYYDGDETIIDLGTVDMPITYNEITNLFTNSDLLPNINAKYYRNFISTVRNLQINEKALKQELVDINTRLSALETAQTNVASESEVVE